MRTSTGVASIVLSCLLLACGPGTIESGDGDGGASDGGTGADACVGLACFQVSCPGGGSTTLSGTVYAPNGTLPLYGVTVYVPNGPVDALPSGATCDRCGAPLSGNPLVSATSNEAGQFTLENVPATSAVPLVIQVGKWRRQIVVPAVAACVDTALTADQARLPRNKSEGDIPQMALTTGGADSLECLLRKIGLDDAEFTNRSGTGRVHLFGGVDGTPRFATTLNGGADFANATTLWDTTPHLMPYDVTFLSCEGAQNPNTKPQTSLQALSDYTNVGGRVFASHWHNYWIEAAPAPTLWPTTITPNHLGALNSVRADINTGFPKGNSLATWLANVGGSPPGLTGKIDLTESKHTVEAVNPATTERWISLAQTANNRTSVQYYQFTTPLTVDDDQRCGKVVFSDIHVSAGDDSSAALRFPGGCTTTGLTPQEKVLAFMVFDIASCVGPPIGRTDPDDGAASGAEAGDVPGRVD